MFKFSKVDFIGKWWCMFTPDGWLFEPIIGKGETKAKAKQNALRFYEDQILNPKPFKK